MLLHYAWQNDYCFPGQERLAEDMGSSKRSVIRFMGSSRSGLIEVKRRGHGQTNLYKLYLHATKKQRLAKPEVPIWHVQDTPSCHSCDANLAALSI